MRKSHSDMALCVESQGDFSHTLGRKPCTDVLGLHSGALAVTVPERVVPMGKEHPWAGDFLQLISSR